MFSSLAVRGLKDNSKPIRSLFFFFPKYIVRTLSLVKECCGIINYKYIIVNIIIYVNTNYK